MESNIYLGNCTELIKQIESNSVDLIITSPPYNINKDSWDNLSFAEYENLCLSLFQNTYRILKDDGRYCINIGDWMPTLNQSGLLFMLQVLEKVGFKNRFTVTWVKTRKEGDPQNYCGCNTAWGSYKSASSPSLLSYSELILIGYKNQWKKVNKGISTISEKEFMEYIKSTWYFPQEIYYQKFHSAPFPEELPYRCIQLFSYLGDSILDPFSGSGTTCCVAKKLGRNYIGFELDEKYYKLSLGRLDRTLLDNDWIQNRIQIRPKKEVKQETYW